MSKPAKGNGSRERAASPIAKLISSSEATAAQPTYKAHPLAMALPPMPDNELAELADDIKQNGLLTPIVLFAGLILDGRQRYAACKLAGVYPITVRFEKLPPEVQKQGPVAYVLSQNLFRRHLTDDQRVAIVTKLRKPQFEAEARERQKAGLRKGDKSPVVSISTQRETPSKSPSEPTVLSKSATPSVPTHIAIAKKAKSTPYKARQAGKLTAEELDDVAIGRKKLRDIEKRRPRREQSKKEKPFEERIWARWQLWLKKFPPAEVRDIKRLVHKWTEVKGCHIPATTIR